MMWWASRRVARPLRSRSVDTVNPALLLFLSSICHGCQDLWAGVAELRDVIPDDFRIVVVTRGPESENATAIGELAQPGTEVVMSTQAYADYRVAGPPFMAVIAGGLVKTEGVAWGIEETGRATRAALTGGNG